MRSAFVHHHLGLGDHIVCNGLVREVLKVGFDFLYLPVKKHNYETVGRMYSDESRIMCLPVSTDADVPHLPQLMRSSKFYRVGFEKCRADWDVSFYDSIGVPFQKRWDSFRVSRDQSREASLLRTLNLNEGDAFTLIHDTGSVGRFPISVSNDAGRIVRVEPLTDSMLDWCGVIERAKEIHCIDSSFIHLAQSMRPDGFFHDIREPHGTKFSLREGWKAVKIGA